MRHLLRVLIQTLARFFQGCADALGALGGAPGPAVGELPAAVVSSGRPAGPPEDWSRRASPPPPAHWVELVKERAPGFLGQEAGTPESRLRLVRPSPVLPVAGAPSLRPSEVRRVPATHVRTPESAVPERTSLSGASISPKTTRVSEPPRVKGPRTVRIVTGIEESPSRPAAVVQLESSATGDPGIRETYPRERPGRDSRALGTFRTFVPPPEVRPDSSPSFLDKFEAAGDEELWQPRPGPVSESRIVSSRSGFAVIPALKISRANPRSPLIGVQALPSDPGKGEHREASSFSREAASWPELLVSEEREDLEDARMLCRELRRLALLEEEQRGIPWSA